MSRMAHGRLTRGVDDENNVDKTNQIQLPAEPELSDEEQKTRVWRRDQFVSLGFELPRAAIMAVDTSVDLAQARRLVALGCPLETASRILL